jgi:hypothetical protein
MMCSFVVASAIGGQIISRTGRYKLQATLGAGIAVVGFYLFSRLSAESGSAEVIRDMIVLGLGIGTSMPIFSMTIQSAFPHSMLGTVNSARQLFVNLAGAISIPVFTALIVNTFQRDLPRYVPPALRDEIARGAQSPQSLLTAESQARVARRFEALPQGHELYLRYIAGIRHALANGIVQIFVIGVGLAALAFVLTLVFPRIELATWEGGRETAEPAPDAA